MTNGRGHLGETTVGLQVVSTPKKVTLVFDQFVRYLPLTSESARKLAGTIVEAADLAEREEHGTSSESEGQSETCGPERGGSGEDDSGEQ